MLVIGLDRCLINSLAQEHPDTNTVTACSVPSPETRRDVWKATADFPFIPPLVNAGGVRDGNSFCRAALS